MSKRPAPRRLSCTAPFLLALSSGLTSASAQAVVSEEGAAVTGVRGESAEDVESADPRRQFDFWVGEWSVQNRHLGPDGVWRDGTVTRARITPVCGGAAILEEWAGPLNGAFMNGFSLRAWNPDERAWDLILFWTVDGNSSFGRMEGTFRHGRGEFFGPGQGPSRTRYTFSDALPDTVRWDSARTSDGGQHWRTDWIMEFSRTRAAAETTQERLLTVAWTDGRLSPHARARELDWSLGEWRGVRSLPDGSELELRLSCKFLAKDCLVLGILGARRAGAGPSEPWDESLVVRGYEAGNDAWKSWRVTRDDTRLVPGATSFEDGVAVTSFQVTPLRPGGGDGGERWVEYWIPGDDRLEIELSRLAPDGTQELLHSDALERVR